MCVCVSAQVEGRGSEGLNGVFGAGCCGACRPSKYFMSNLISGTRVRPSQGVETDSDLGDSWVKCVCVCVCVSECYNWL